MGQAQSVPTALQSPLPRASAAAVDDGKNPNALRVPSAWKNDADFLLISPASDLSNPSQFRGRLRHNAPPLPATAKTAAAAAAAPATQIPVSAVRRSRTSKVCPKQHPPASAVAAQRTHLPPPTRFYFASTPNRYDNENDDAIHEQQAIPEHEALEPKPMEQPPKRTLAATWKAKCAKAKQQLGECWSDKEIDEPEHTVRHYSQREHSNEQPVAAAGGTGPSFMPPAPYLQLEQFEPVWKEQLEEIPSTNVDGTKKSLGKQPIAANGAPAITPCAMQPGSKSFVPPSLHGTDVLKVPAQLPSVTNSAYETGEESSGLAGRALSLNSHRLSRGSYSTSTSASGVTTVLQEGRTPQVANVNRRDSHNTKSTVVSTVLQNHNGKNAVFRNSSSQQQHGTKQAELLVGDRRRVASNDRPTAVLSAAEHARRADIEQQVQQQIDAQFQAQTMSRVQRLRQQYQQELERMKVVQPPLKSAPTEEKRTSRNDRFSIPASNVSEQPKLDAVETKRISVSEQRKVFEQRATSVPGRRSSEATYDRAPPAKQPQQQSSTVAAPTVARRRSVSAPKSRPSIDGSALLHLTGNWNSKIVVAKDTNRQHLPVLLKVAGWEKENQQVIGKRSSMGKRASIGSVPSKVVAAPKNSNVGKSKEDRLSTQSAPAPAASAKPLVTRRKAASLELPRREPPVRKGRTIALMLQQAYFQEEDDEEKDTAVSNKPNYLALAYQSPTFRSNALVECSPAVSVESMNTAASGPLVSDQALTNAEFLFEADANLTNIPTIKSALSLDGECSIDTWKSNSRVLQTAAGQAAKIAVNVSTHTAPNERLSYGPGRRVRFSEDNSQFDSMQRLDAVDNVAVPGIESKLSDLTDTTGANTAQYKASKRESTTSSHSSMSIPRIDSIPEEDDDESPALHISMLSNDEKVDIIFEDIEDDEEVTPQKLPIMRWSYRTDGGLMNGVTPNLNGKNGSSRVTSSPYIRFKEAKDKFATGKLESAASLSQKRHSPVKRASPIKRAVGSLVTTRVAAMEGRRVRSEGGSTFKMVRAKKKRRATTGNEVLAPRKGNLVSPMFKSKPMKSVKVDTMDDKLAVSETAAAMPSLPVRNDSALTRVRDSLQSPTLVDGHVVAKQQCQPTKLNHFRELNDSGLASVVSTDSDDAFGAILHPTAIDEDSDDERMEGQQEAAVEADGLCESESDDDDFNNLLKYEESEEETSLQQYTSERLLHSGSQMSVDARSIISSSSNDETASIPSWLKSRKSIASQDDYSVVSAVERMKNALPFREAAPVKPNEQQHRAVPGSDCLSMMQRTPTQARKWRVLAAAAHEKDSRRNHDGRSSLSERSLNTMGR
jgi:hypothetical protein